MQFHVNYIGDWWFVVYTLLNINEVQIIARARKIHFINICISLIVGNDCIKCKNLLDISHHFSVSIVDGLMLICLVYMLVLTSGCCRCVTSCYCS